MLYFLISDYHYYMRHIDDNEMQSYFICQLHLQRYRKLQRRYVSGHWFLMKTLSTQSSLQVLNVCKWNFQAPRILPRWNILRVPHAFIFSIEVSARSCRVHSDEAQTLHNPKIILLTISPNGPKICVPLTIVHWVTTALSKLVLLNKFK